MPFLATFDVHWVDERIGVDWKVSEQKEKYSEDYDIQAYILNELFKQKYKNNLRKFYFVYLKDGSNYEAQSIYDGKVRNRTENKILNAIEGIKKLEFKKKTSWACEWCEYRSLCI
ncbi:MAG TPA: PD-(D/E)XK nuclease family protein [Clostridium sp.]